MEILNVSKEEYDNFNGIKSRNIHPEPFGEITISYTIMEGTQNA